LYDRPHKVLGKFMKISGLLHFNIRCSATDLPALEKFYSNLLDMKPGYRPNFAFPGAWLYVGDAAVIHVSARFAEGEIARHQKHNGSVDHIAFRCTGSAALRERLMEQAMPFEEQNIENAGYQIFLFDPVGTKIELNFPNSEAPASVPLGTRARMNVS
jgi:extradiol dioxygenase family protein